MLTKKMLEAMGDAFADDTQPVTLTYSWFKSLREMALKSIEQEQEILALKERRGELTLELTAARLNAEANAPRLICRGIKK